MVELPGEEVPLLELPTGAFEPFGWTAYHRGSEQVDAVPGLTSPGLESAVYV